MSNYPWRLHSLWGEEKKLWRSARSEADQMTSAFQVFFNIRRWKENAKKWILVWIPPPQIPLILSIFWLLSGQKKTLKNQYLYFQGAYLHPDEQIKVESNQVHLKRKGQR